MRLIKEKTKIDFLGKSRRKGALGISIAMIVLSIASLATRGLDNLRACDRRPVERPRDAGRDQIPNRSSAWVRRCHPRSTRTRVSR